MDIQASEMVHQLLFHALTEMRTEGHDSGNKIVYHLAHLFHNVVKEMAAAANEGSDVTYDDVMDRLKQQAEHQGCDAWLTQRLAEIESNIHANAHTD